PASSRSRPTKMLVAPPSDSCTSLMLAIRLFRSIIHTSLDSGFSSRDPTVRGKMTWRGSSGRAAAYRSRGSCLVQTPMPCELEAIVVGLHSTALWSRGRVESHVIEIDLLSIGVRGEADLQWLAQLRMVRGSGK